MSAWTLPGERVGYRIDAVGKSKPPLTGDVWTTPREPLRPDEIASWGPAQQVRPPQPFDRP